MTSLIRIRRSATIVLLKLQRVALLCFPLPAVDIGATPHVWGYYSELFSSTLSGTIEEITITRLGTAPNSGLSENHP